MTVCRTEHAPPSLLSSIPLASGAAPVSMLEVASGVVPVSGDVLESGTTAASTAVDDSSPKPKAASSPPSVLVTLTVHPELASTTASNRPKLEIQAKCFICLSQFCPVESVGTIWDGPRACLLQFLSRAPLFLRNAATNAPSDTKSHGQSPSFSYTVRERIQ